MSCFSIILLIIFNKITIVPLFSDWRIAVYKKLINFFKIDSSLGLISQSYVTSLSTPIIASARAYFSNSIYSSIFGDLLISFTNLIHYNSYCVGFMSPRLCLLFLLFKLMLRFKFTPRLLNTFPDFC